MSRDVEILDASNSILNYKSDLERKFEDKVEAENAAVAEKFIRDKDVVEAFDYYYLKPQERLSAKISKSASDYYRLKDSGLKTSDVLEARKRSVQNALEIVLEKLNAQTVAIFILNKDGILERFAISGYDKNGKAIDASWYGDETYEIQDNSFVGGAAVPRGDLKYGTAQYSSNLSNEENLDLYGKQQYTQKCGPLGSAIAIPINDRNKTYGVLRVINCVDSKTKLPDPNTVFDSNEDVVWLSLLTTNISNILSDFKHDSRDKILEHFYHALSNTPEDLESFYKKSVDLLVKSPDTLFKSAVLRILAPQTQSLEVIAVSLFDNVLSGRNDSPVKIGEGLAGWVAQDRIPLILPKIHFNGELLRIKDRDWINHQWIGENKFQAFGCFPLIARGELLGTLSFYTGCAYDFHEDIDGFTFIKSVAQLLALFIFFNSHSFQTESIEDIINKRILQKKRIGYQYDAVLLGDISKNKDKVQKIAQALINRGILPWVEGDEMKSSVDKQSSIEKALKNTKIVAICVSNIKNAPWHDPQKRAFLRDSIKVDIPVFLIIFDGFNDSYDLPVFLEKIDCIDFRNDFDTALLELAGRIGGETLNL